jgi:hypothetical protein
MPEANGNLGKAEGYSYYSLIFRCLYKLQNMTPKPTTIRKIQSASRQEDKIGIKSENATKMIAAPKAA